MIPPHSRPDPVHVRRPRLLALLRSPAPASSPPFAIATPSPDAAIPRTRHATVTSSTASTPSWRCITCRCCNQNRGAFALMPCRSLLVHGSMPKHSSSTSPKGTPSSPTSHCQSTVSSPVPRHRSCDASWTLLPPRRRARDRPGAPAAPPVAIPQHLPCLSMRVPEQPGCG